MKKSLMIGALALTALVQAQPSQAYFRGNYCAKIDIGGGVVQERCDFRNAAACMEYTGTMPKSFCVQNQWSSRNWGVHDEVDRAQFNYRYR